METIIVTISAEQAECLRARIAAKQYASLDEIVREALYIWEAVRTATDGPVSSRPPLETVVE